MDALFRTTEEYNMMSPHYLSVRPLHLYSRLYSRSLFHVPTSQLPNGLNINFNGSNAHAL